MATCGAAVCLVALLSGPTQVSALVISSATLRPDRPGGGDSGGIEVLALLTASDAGADLVQHLTSGAVALSVSDGGVFNATVALSGCRVRTSGRVSCRSDAPRVRARLKPVAQAPYVYELHVRVRQLGPSSTGLDLPAAPVRVVLHQPDPVQRVGTVAGCRQAGTRGLRCAGTRRPNVVFIVTDDQRWDTLASMPSVQALAAEGVRFANAFAPTPLCGPSRASMLTGQYAHHTGVLTNGPVDGGALRFVGPDASTLATWLHDAGYTTGMYGKYMVGYFRQCPPYTSAAYVPPGWDQWHVFRNQGYFDYQLAENGPLVAYGSLDGDYSTDVLAAKVVDFVDEARGQPFFVHLGLAAPHTQGTGPPLPAPRHATLFDALPPWRPLGYDEPDFGDKPGWMQALPRAADLLAPPFITYASWTDFVRRAQLASLAAVDEAIAAVVAALEASGEADNTIVVFTSDNGYLWGEHRAFTKKSFAFEESIRVPLIMRVPPAIGGPRDEQRLALTIDIAPTLAELAGVQPASPVDGVSLAPLLRGDATAWREDFLLEFFRFAPDSVPTYVGVRTERWKYVAYPESGDAELYDLMDDAGELANLAGDPAHASTVATLAARTAALSGM
jgi:arylsulfatase A-like enzyme